MNCQDGGSVDREVIEYCLKAIAYEFHKFEETRDMDIDAALVHLDTADQRLQELQDYIQAVPDIHPGFKRLGEYSFMDLVRLGDLIRIKKACR